MYGRNESFRITAGHRRIIALGIVFIMLCCTLLTPVDALAPGTPSEIPVDTVQQGAPLPCTCVEKCTDEHINAECPLCAAEHTSCAGTPQAEETVHLCTCIEKCTDEHTNTECPVCATDHAACVGTPQAEETVHLCTCIEKCTDEHTNADCPVCSENHAACEGIEQAEETVPLCICTEKCTDEHTNADCPVCSENHAACEGIEQIAATLPVYELVDRVLDKTAADGALISVSGLLPAVAELEVTVVPVEDVAAFVDEGDSVLFAYDIKIMVPATPTGATPTDATPEMTEYQPTVPVSVSITPPEDKPIDAPVEVTHIDADNNAAPVEAETVDGTVEFEAEGFSVYVVTMGPYTPRVTFSYDNTYFNVEYCTTSDGSYNLLTENISVEPAGSLYFKVTGGENAFAWRDGVQITADDNGVYTVDNITANTIITITNYAGSNVTLNVEYGPIVIGEDNGSGGRKYTYWREGGVQETGTHVPGNIYTITGMTGTPADGGGYNVSLTGEGDFNIVLDNVSICTGTPGSNGEGQCAPVSTHKVQGDGNIIITLVGTSTLKNVSGNASDSYAALEKSDNPSTLIINGNGTLYAIGGADSAGIGSSDQLGAGTENITINSGTISATSIGSQGAGIGSGNNEVANNIRIYGGDITAIGFNNGAGIGGSGSVTYTATRGQVYIYGGTINATSNGKGAGIGGGGSGDGNQAEVGYGGDGEVHIYGGTITADSIGGGDGGKSGGAATVNIYGGKVTTGGSIGGGNSTRGSGGLATIAISGGTISAANISGGHGVGGAHAGGTLTVTGGSAKVEHVCPAITTTGIGGNAPLTYNVFVASGTTAVKNANVTNITIDPPLAEGATYGLTDVYTDDDGRLYLWLPAGKQVTNVTVSVDGNSATYNTSTVHAAAYITPAATSQGNIAFGTTLTANLSYGTPTSFRWEKFSTATWTTISGATYNSYTPTVGDIGEIRVVIIAAGVEYTSPSVFIIPPTISATVPLNVTVTVDASGNFTAPLSDAYKITNNSAVDIYLTDVALAWDTTNAPTVFSDYAKLGAALTLRDTSYSFGGGTMSQAIPSTNGAIGYEGGTLPLAWEFSLNTAGSGNYIRAVQSVKFATVTYTVSYIAPTP